MSSSDKTFKQDHSKTNPDLHLLYVKWAVQHLTSIDRAIKRLSSYANINMLDVTIAIASERRKLVEDNAAYADAQEILDMIMKAK